MISLGIPSAQEIRRRILEVAFTAQCVHIPSAFSIVEIVRVLHESVLNYPGNDPRSVNRDFFVLSKGHGVMALYPILESRGWIDKSLFDQYFQNGSVLPGLAEAIVPGCEANTGSLGQGLGVAVGLALAIKLKNSDQKVFCLVGDGELNEGSTFEALSFASQHKLSNLNVIVDLNGLQAMGATQDIISQGKLQELLTSLGFHVEEVDGHNQEQLRIAFTKTSEDRSQPRAFVATTVKGKGISFMEKDNSWHYRRLNEELLRISLNELRKADA